MLVFFVVVDGWLVDWVWFGLVVSRCLPTSCPFFLVFEKSCSLPVFCCQYGNTVSIFFFSKIICLSAVSVVVHHLTSVSVIIRQFVCLWAVSIIVRLPVGCEHNCPSVCRLSA